MSVPPIHSSRRILALDTPVQYLKGVGPRRAEKLVQLGIRTVGDLVEYPPFRYEDRTRFRLISSLREGDWALIRGEIASLGGYDARRRGFSILEMLVRDRTAGILVKFFNQPYLRNVYRERMRIIVYGQVKRDEYSRGALSLLNPECEIDDEAAESIHSGRIVPIYRKLGEMRSRTLRRVMYGLVSQLPEDMSDTLPPYLRRRFNLLSRAEALSRLHFPEIPATSGPERERAMAELNNSFSPAHRRLMFEELFDLQVGIGMVREQRVHSVKERSVKLGGLVREAIKKILPFHPTRAQKRVLKEIADDLCRPQPMSRLLQGDVGSGKTIVAAQAAVIAVENGFQVAVMAPTEILAEQHDFCFKRLFAPIGYRVDLLKHSLRAREKREALDRIRSGETQVVVGTHALIQEAVEFRNLALVIIDEQHRFGVVQRNLLREKGQHPDLLVMTATPIPRSLALTLYGDLDLSVIDEMPPGRKPVETIWLEEKDRARVYQEIRDTVGRNQQVYIVYPLVEESEKVDLRAATEMSDHLKGKVFPDLEIGLLHGRMKSPEKEECMTAFARGEINILVSTTVIEVGVDVSNATLMVVENAERFGLAQLHQLRGRVGRGSAQSRCLLVATIKENPEARRRIEIMCATNDGFRIAEVDLELRGPGEIIGTRQSGVPVFKHANLVRDRKALEVARREAERFLRLLGERPRELRGFAGIIRQKWKERYGLVLAG